MSLTVLGGAHSGLKDDGGGPETVMTFVDPVTFDLTRSEGVLSISRSLFRVNTRLNPPFVSVYGN